jgi:hypothetical protein
MQANMCVQNGLGSFDFACAVLDLFGKFRVSFGSVGSASVHVVLHGWLRLWLGSPATLFLRMKMQAAYPPSKIQQERFFGRFGPESGELGACSLFFQDIWWYLNCKAGVFSWVLLAVTFRAFLQQWHITFRFFRGYHTCQRQGARLRAVLNF